MIPYSDLCEILAIMQEHTGYVNCIAFSPNGTYLASASNDKTVRIWDMGRSRCRETLKVRGMALTVS